MKKCITDYLDAINEKYKNKVAVIEKGKTVTYEDLKISSKKVATSIINNNLFNKPIAIFIDKSINLLSSMLGVTYSGNFYTVIDVNMPINRIETIFNTLKPELVITDNKNIKKFQSMNINKQIICYEECQNLEIDDENIKKVNDKICDINPMYVLFTSGSTGTPKGSVISHRAVISYTKWFSETFNIDKDTVFGSQTPFYFSMSVSDVFSSIVNGATLCIIPKTYFSFPTYLINFLNENKVNTIYWVPSALQIVANLNTFDYVKPMYLKKVLFAGEVMPMKPLNTWRKYLPNCLYANLYGPTELTDICTYYIVNRTFNDNETLPIGRPCNNCEAIILDEEGKMAENGKEGQLCIKGSILGLGYYNNKEKTDETFIQNPLNPYYNELIYKTGDIVKYNEYGELIYLSRKDFQIKHMGYRIELGEIETNINACSGIVTCCVTYIDNNIILNYVGDIKEEELVKYINEKLLNYMRPNKIIKLDKMPYNANGKIDRVKIKEMDRSI